MADPISVGTCAVWFDAADATTIHATTGSVDTWDDKSGNARNATATTTLRPTTGTRTLNGRNVLDFDGSTDYMKTASFTTAVPFTIGVVALNDSGADGTTQILAGSVTSGADIEKSSANLWRCNGGTNLNNGTPDTAAHIFIGTFRSGATAVNRVDATEVTGTVGTNSVNGGFGIGAFGTPSLFWNGIIAEVVMYTIELNSTNRGLLYDYFTAKWFTAPTFAPPPQNKTRRLLPILVR